VTQASEISIADIVSKTSFKASVRLMQAIESAMPGCILSKTIEPVSLLPHRNPDSQTLGDSAVTTLPARSNATFER
jgi:hypothetical protein